jgi:SPP1 family predicted phage head-tail adaptor
MKLQLPTSGKRNVRITFEADKGTERTDSGDRIEDWQQLFKRWAEVVQLSGRELVNAKEVHASATHRITVVSDSSIESIDTKYRIRAKGRTYNIVSINNTESRDREVVILCGEHASGVNCQS